jgi:hypothetical protein
MYGVVKFPEIDSDTCYRYYFSVAPRPLLPLNICSKPILYISYHVQGEEVRGVLYISTVLRHSMHVSVCLGLY